MPALSSFVQGFNWLFAAGVSAVVTTYAVKYNVYKDFSPDYTLMLTIVAYFSAANTYVSDIVDYVLRDNGCGKVLKFFTSVCLMLVLIATGIAVIVIIPERLPWNMLTQVVTYQLNVTELRVWDHVHQDFQCCGLFNYTDWMNQGELEGNSLPDSCCKNFTLGCASGILDDPTLYNGSIYTQGCTQAGFFDFFFPWTYAISGCSIAINFFNVVYTLISCGDGEGVEVGPS